MHKSAAELEQHIRSHKPMTLPAWGSDETIFPYYDGLSLRNVPHTIADMLGAPLPQSTPLSDDVWQAEKPQARRVVVILIDGMGYQHLQMLAADDPAIRQAVADITQGRGFVPTTSVAPSTTVVALTSLWTGATPRASGVIGTTMYLHELGMQANMIRLVPTVGKYTGDIIIDWGMDTADFVAVPGLVEHFDQHNIPTYSVIDKLYVYSGLSRILHRQLPAANVYTHTAASDFYLRLRDALDATRGTRCYINAYWSAVDSIAHLHGAHTKYTHAEIKAQLLALRDLLDDVDDDGQTLVMITADHGHYDSTTPIDLNADPVLRDAMTFGIWGDERLAQMRVHASSLAAVKQHLDDRYTDKLIYLDVDEALNGGLLGAGAQSPKTRQRLGDLILIPRLGYIVVDSSKGGALPMISRHAGLDAWEMLTPFMWRTV